MALKRLVPDIGAMLREGHFGNPDSEMPPPADPVTVTQMVLEVSRIEPYDRNPRQDANPRYAEIKESIRAQRGLNNALEITRRPGAERYMIRAGGNTRLQILKELLAETGDPVFAQVHCLFHPWTSEAVVLTAHMIENELRGEMSLIDKALGLQALKAEIEAESGKALSSRDLVRKLAESGYTISRRHLARFQYAAEALYPLIPTALRSGMGRPQIDAMRNLESAFRAYWTDAGGDPDRFQTVCWTETLLTLDGSEFDVAVARQEFESRIAGLLEHPVSRIRIAVDALLSGRAGATEDPQDGAEAAQEVSSGEPSTTVAAEPSAPKDAHPPEAMPSATAMESSTASVPASSSSPPSPAATDGGVPAAEPPPQAGPSPDERRDPAAEFVPGAYTGPTDLKSLRARNYVLSLQIAQRTGLGGECIRKLPSMGMGYLVDIPDEPVTGDGREETLRRWLWWFMFALSEFYADPARAEYLVNKQLVPAGFLTRDDAEDFVGHGPPPVGALVAQLLSSPLLSDRDFHGLCQLMESCRLTRRLCPDKEGDSLWRHGWDDGREVRP
jgi:ParB family protein of integrating conjugative element (PFGI_1 class)